MKTIKKSKKYWSGEVTQTSNALDLEQGVFTWRDPKKIAKSLKKSAEESLRRKGTAYQSAMSMLNFYINRAGKNLSSSQRRILEQAKIELKILFQFKNAR
jgi:putative cell wall-binding protein